MLLHRRTSAAVGNNRRFCGTGVLPVVHGLRYTGINRRTLYCHRGTFVQYDARKPSEFQSGRSHCNHNAASVNRKHSSSELSSEIQRTLQQNHKNRNEKKSGARHNPSTCFSGNNHLHSFDFCRSIRCTVRSGMAVQYERNAQKPKIGICRLKSGTRFH